MVVDSRGSFSVLTQFKFLFGDSFTLLLREGQLVVRLSDPNSLLPLIRLLKLSLLFRFSRLQDLFSVDYPQRAIRFEVNYLLNSPFHNCNLLIQLSTPDGVPSLVQLYPNANWLEREVWDLYGVFFYNHPDLRRILTDYGFSGFPLRKDFPLVGFEEVRYDEQTKKVVLDPVEFSQEYRYFDFKSPWL